jgi:ABC-type lipoprotein export system ATPase subunit
LNNIIQCQNLSKVVHPSGPVIFSNLSFEIAKPTTLAIMGPSGSGKSTFLNIIGLLDSASSGSYFLHGHDINQLSTQAMLSLRKRYFGYIFQQYQLIHHLSVYDNIMLPLSYLDDPSSHENRVDSLMERLQISKLQDRYPYQLSGGEQQRVGIARALITNPSILLADEPTGALDQINTDLTLDILSDIYRDFSTTIIVVTHDPYVANRCAHTWHFATDHQGAYHAA